MVPIVEIKVERMRLYARHGVMWQELNAGNIFEVTVRVKTPSQGAVDDNIDHTISYANICHVIKEEMNTPSDLLEHVCYKMCERILGEWPEVMEVTTEVAKLTPPIAGVQLERVSASLTMCSAPDL